MDELNIADKFYIDANLDRTSEELAHILKKGKTLIEVYMAVEAQKKYEQERQSSQKTKPDSLDSATLSSSDPVLSLPNLDLDTPQVKQPEVIKARENKSILREAFARRGTFTAMTASAGMISDEIQKVKGGQSLYSDSVIPATGR